MSQLTRKKYIKTSLNTQILQAIDAALSERVVPQLQSSLERLKQSLNAKMDKKSSGVESYPKTNWTAENIRIGSKQACRCNTSQFRRESSVDSQQTHDTRGYP